MIGLNGYKNGKAMIEQWIWSLVDSVFAATEHIAISTRSHDTSCISGYRPPIATASHTRIDPISNIWPREAAPFVSMICYNTICIGRLWMDHHIYMRFLIDILICAQHVRPENWWNRWNTIIVLYHQTKQILLHSVNSYLRNSQTNRPMLKRHHQALTAMTLNFQFQSFPMSTSTPANTWNHFRVYSINCT